MGKASRQQVLSELFSCSGITAREAATRNSTSYHNCTVAQGSLWRKRQPEIARLIRTVQLLRDHCGGSGNQKQHVLSELFSSSGIAVAEAATRNSTSYQNCSVAQGSLRRKRQPETARLIRTVQLLREHCGGSGNQKQQVLTELFSCSGIAVAEAATRNHTSYQNCSVAQGSLWGKRQPETARLIRTVQLLRDRCGGSVNQKQHVLSELFSCSGITVAEAATRNSTSYQNCTVAQGSLWLKRQPETARLIRTVQLLRDHCGGSGNQKQHVLSELFSCSGITVAEAATRNSTSYQNCSVAQGSLWRKRQPETARLIRTVQLLRDRCGGSGNQKQHVLSELFSCSGITVAEAATRNSTSYQNCSVAQGSLWRKRQPETARLIRTVQLLRDRCGGSGNQKQHVLSELFSCSGITVAEAATRNSTSYQNRSVAQGSLWRKRQPETASLIRTVQLLRDHCSWSGNQKQRVLSELFSCSGIAVAEAATRNSTSYQNCSVAQGSLWRKRQPETARLIRTVQLLRDRCGGSGNQKQHVLSELFSSSGITVAEAATINIMTTIRDKRDIVWGVLRGTD